MLVADGEWRAPVIELHLRGRVQPGRGADLVAFLREAIPYYEKPGGIRVRLMWDAGDPDRFVEVVEYADRDTHDGDQVRVAEDPRMRELLLRWRELLAEPPHVETYVHAAVGQESA
jgi:hypothetical protein